MAGRGLEPLGDRGGFQKLGGLVRGLAWPRAGERRLRKGPAATMLPGRASPSSARWCSPCLDGPEVSSGAERRG